MLKRIFSQAGGLLAFLTFSFLFWTWVFALRGDTVPAKKLTVYIDAPAVSETALSAALEREKPAGIRMVRARAFSYAMFDAAALEGADVYIVPASKAADYRDSLLSVPADLPRQKIFGGALAGALVYDAAAGSGALTEYVTFLNGAGEPEDFCLFLGAGSVHLEDGLAEWLARALLSMCAGAAGAVLPEGFIRGVDVSALPSVEACGVRFYDEAGSERDPLETLAANGATHIRVRVWNDPYDAAGNGYGGGNCDAANAAALGARAAAAGLKTIVDLHYSDFWADPGKQFPPKAWAGLPLDEKATALAAFTEETLRLLVRAGADIDLVQIGNETNGALCGETEWAAVCRLMNAGAGAVRAAAPGARVAVHFTNPEKPGAYAYYADRLEEYGVDYDVFGSSYYPCWHGTTENLAAVLAAVAEKNGKQVMVLETAYPYTEKDLDFFPNTVSSGRGLPYPLTPAGQAQALRDVIAAAVRAGGCGVVYWEGAWLAAGGASRAENEALWERFGCGWATRAAGAYDPEDAGEYCGGNAVENQALFDENGRPLEAQRVFSETVTKM